MSNKVKTYFFISCFLFLNYTELIGQDILKTLSEYTTLNSSKSELGKIQFAKVDHYTGNLSLSYNLLSYSVEEKQLPIFLSYDGSGVKVAQESSEVGLSWNLTTHPTITREIRGLSDLNEMNLDQTGYVYTDIALPTYSGYISTELDNKIQNSLDISQYYGVGVGIPNWDTEPDIFTLNLMGRSIQFVLPQKGNANIIEASLLDKENKVKIKFDVDTKVFLVTDEEGYVYTFNIKDYAVSTSKSGATSEESLYELGELHLTLGLNDIPLITKWHVSLIKGNKGSEITFKYKIVSRGENPNLSQNFSVLACLWEADYRSYNSYENNYTAVITEHSINQLDSIIMPLGVVRFNYSQRVDLPKSGSYPYMTNLNYAFPIESKPQTLEDVAGKLDSIEVKNFLGERVTNILFKYSYFNSSHISELNDYASQKLRLKLDTLKIGDESYTFLYKNPDSIANKLSRSVDYWGYYNGKINTSRIAQNQVTYHCSQDNLTNCNAGCAKLIQFANPIHIADRSVNFDYASNGVLNKIINPMGGSTIIDYEAHNFFYDGSAETDYGYDFNTEIYNEYEALYESSPVITDPFYFNGTNPPMITFDVICGGDFNNPGGASHYKCDMLFDDSQKIGLELVDVNTASVVKSLSYAQAGPLLFSAVPAGNYYIRFKSLFEPWNFYDNPGSPDHNKLYYFAAKVSIRQKKLDLVEHFNESASGVRVKSIQEFSSNNQLAMKTEYNYQQTDNVKSSGKLAYYLVNFRTDWETFGVGDEPCNTGGVKDFVVFSSDVQVRLPNVFHVGYGRVTEYMEDYNGDKKKGSTTYSFYNGKNIYATNVSGSSVQMFSGVAHNRFSQSYNYFPIMPLSHINGKKIKVESFDFIGDKKFEEIYEYENDYYNFSKVVANGGRVRSEAFKAYNCSGFLFATYHPHSYHSYTIYDLTNPIISKERKTYANDAVLSDKEFFSYDSKFYNTGRLKKLSNDKDKEDLYYYPGDPEVGNWNNVADMLERNMVSLPLKSGTKVNNQLIYKQEAEYSYFNNFLLPSVIKKFNGPTGVEFDKLEMIYDPVSGNIREIKGSNGIKTVYIWGYRGQYPVARVIGSDYNTVINYIDQGILDNGTSSQIEAQLVLLRTGFTSDPLVQVFTYTYKPLVGIKTETASNGKTIYYEYNSFNRLHLVKDDEGKILKRICYNYAGQVEDCGVEVNTAPLWQSTNLTRCQPCAANNAYTSNIQEHQEKDNNPNSPTYNTYRWVSDGANSNCITLADWQNTATAIRCKTNGSSQNTGEQEREQRDMNPCSSTYNQLRWVTTGTNLTSCPLPSACNTSNCIGENRKCIDGICKRALRVYTSSEYNPATGLYDCTYHYEWGDGSWSGNYIEQSSYECEIF